MQGIGPFESRTCLYCSAVTKYSNQKLQILFDLLIHDEMLWNWVSDFCLYLELDAQWKFECLHVRAMFIYTVYVCVYFFISITVLSLQTTLYGEIITDKGPIDL